MLSVIPNTRATPTLRIANDSDYGLSGSVWTADEERSLAVAAGVRAGSFGVNPAVLDGPGGALRRREGQRPLP